ncbi:MAG TPA: AAA family ATPase, partial [Bacteroidales bacterium]|nr:AAA family ATPase [Bacteroidales bacterium]
MKREKLSELRAWKNKKKRKPLIIKGARQVGKTWLMKSFGKSDYKHCAYINFEKKQSLKPLFLANINIDNIISAIQIETSTPVLPNETLIILDEIQAIPEALTALKYFNEDAPQYHIIAAGSLLGVSLHSSISFPVGNVEFCDLMPLNYIEFLDAMGDDSLSALLRTQNWDLIHVYKDRFINRLRQYYYLGGMPEVVADFSKNENPDSARKIQEDILKTYELDFSKYPPAHVVPRIRMLWNAVPAQLAKENKKLIFSALKEGGRAKDFEYALSWLEDSGLI